MKVVIVGGVAGGASAAARIRAAAAAVPDAPIVRTAVSDFTAMVFPPLAAAQSSRRAGGTQ